MINMTKRRFSDWLSDWLDGWKLAAEGLVLATRKPRFWVAFLITFVVFGTLMNLLAGGTAAFNLMGVVDFGGKMQIIGDAFLGLFGVGREFLDWLLYFAIALLQGLLVGLVVVVWRVRSTKLKQSRKPADTKAAEGDNSDHIQRAGLAAGLAVLGSGCPTCGTTLLAPLIGAISSSGGLALAGLLSGLLTTLSVLVALWALRKIGKEAFVELTNENNIGNLKREQKGKNE